MIKKYNKLKTGLLFFLATWLFTGIYVDDEFHEHGIFLKHQPSLQFYFRSPLGMQDMPKNYPIKT